MAEPTLFPPTTAIEMVRNVLGLRMWLTSWEIQNTINGEFGVLYSESGITARIRDLRKAQHGGERIDCRRRKDTKSYEYMMGARR